MGPPLTYILRAAQCLMVHLRRGEGGPPTPSTPKASWGLSLIGSLPSHVTLCFSIKNQRPHAKLQSLDDPGISSEGQQVIDPFT